MTYTMALRGGTLDSTFPVYSSSDEKSWIIANKGAVPGLVLNYWLQADETYTTVSGAAISSLNDVLGGARAFTQTTGTAQPALVSAKLNGLEGAVFDGSSNVLTYNTTPTATTYFLAGVIIPDLTGSPPGLRTIWYWYQDAARQCVVYFEGTSLKVNVNGTITTMAILADDAPVFFALTYNGSLMKYVINGQSVPTSVVVTGSAVYPTAIPLLGAASDASPSATAYPGTIIDLWFGSRDLLFTSNLPLFAHIQEYARGTYSLWTKET